MPLGRLPPEAGRCGRSSAGPNGPACFRPASRYGISKLEGEESVARERAGPWCVIRPCTVYGPGDPGLLQLFSIVDRGWAPVLAGGRSRIQLISAADLARVIVAASDRADL